MKKGQGKKLAAATAAMFIAEPVLALAHTGGAGVIVGLAAGAAAYLVADEVHKGKGGDELDEELKLPKPKMPGKSSLAYRLLNGKSVRGEEDSSPSLMPDGLPRRSPSFAEMKHLIKQGRDILGFDGQKFVSGVSFSQSVNVAVIGMPRHGKTTCLRFHVAQGLVHHAIVRGWDVQGDVAGEFGDYLSIAETVNDILADCAWIDQELKRRAALRKRAQRHDPQAEQEWSQMRELLYVIDEFLLLTTVEIRTKPERDTVTNALLSLIAGASKYKVRVILSGQALPATLFGDTGSATKDIISTKYAFASEDRQARMIGIEEKAIKELMPRIAGEDIQGYAILAGGPLVANKIVSIPDTTFEDIEELLQEQGYTNGCGNDQDEDDEEMPEGITEGDLEQIVQAHNAGWRLRDIADLVQMDLRTFRTACELAGILQAGQSVHQRSPMGQVPDTDDDDAIPPLKLMPNPVTGGPRRAEYRDAVEVWNTIGEPIGRPRLKKELEARGLECSDDLAKKLLAMIYAALEKQTAEAGGDVAVGGGGE